MLGSNCTDWDMFMTASNSLDELTEAVTSYISFCEDCFIPTRTRVSYNNDKPWFTGKLRRLRLDKEDAFRSGDKDRFKESKKRFSKAVREAKRLYSERLKRQFSTNDSASVWRGLRQITNYRPRAPHSTNDSRLANDLNEFYCRFERQLESQFFVIFVFFVFLYCKLGNLYFIVYFIGCATKSWRILCYLTYIFFIIYFPTPKDRSICGLHRERPDQKFRLGSD